MTEYREECTSRGEGHVFEYRFRDRNLLYAGGG